MSKIGICGCGFVGGAIINYCKLNKLNFVCYDKYKKNMKNFNVLLRFDKKKRVFFFNRFII